MTELAHRAVGTSRDGEGQPVGTSCCKCGRGNNLPDVIAAAIALGKRFPGLHFVIAAATSHKHQYSAVSPAIGREKNFGAPQFC